MDLAPLNAAGMPQGRVLVFNAGSATLKYTVLDLPSTGPLVDRTLPWSATTPAAVSAVVGDAIAQLDADGLTNDGLDVVGHRVVHGGERFTESTLIDDPLIADLERIADLAPLHDPLATATIRAARSRLGAIPHVAAFDTAFHATLPEVARRYPVPDPWVETHGVRRFGFHGLSIQWSVGAASSLLGRPVDQVRLVVAHLGGGCSVTAVDRGRSVDTSMGMTPLEGLMMGTRAGSIDPGIVFRLIRAGVIAEDVERQLDHESGLRGVGGTDDMQQLLALERDGDRRATLAIELFVRRAAAGIAAAATSLDGLDALVFTGGIGEHAATVRSRICARSAVLGIPSIPARDAAAGMLTRPGDRPAVIVVHAREDVVIAEEALRVAERTRPSGR